MERLTLAAYRFFKKHRAAFYFILIGSFLCFAFLASKMYYEEDIAKLLPSKKNNDGARFAFEKLQVKDKIFLEFIPRATLKSEVDSQEKSLVCDELISICDEFCDSLLTIDGQTDINNIFYKFGPDDISPIATYVAENAPIFLPLEVYPFLENRLEPKVLDSMMKANLSLLESEGGSYYYDIIAADPLALRDLAMSGGEESTMGATIVDGHFFSSDTSLLVAFLTPSFKAMDSKAGTRLINKILEQSESFEKEYPNVAIRFFGAPVQSVFNAKRIKKDLILTVGIALLLISLLIVVCMRRFRTLAFLIMPLVYGIVFAIAIVYLIKGQMSFIALGIGSIVVGVALSYCLHIITHHKYVDDVEQVIKDQTRPVILGCITTIGSLLGLIFTRSSLLQDFGIMASLVMVGTTLFSLFFLPQFFTPSHHQKNDKAFSAIEKITTYPYYSLKWLIVLIIALFVGSIIITKGKAVFDLDLKNIGYHEPKVVEGDSLYNVKFDGGERSDFVAVYSKDLDSAVVLNDRLNALCVSLKENGIISQFTNPRALLLPQSVQEERIARWENYFTPNKISSIREKISKAARSNDMEADLFDPFYSIIEGKYKPINIVESEIIPPYIASNFVEHTDSTYLIFTSIRTISEENKQKALDQIAFDEKGTLVLDPFFYTADMVELMSHDFTTVLLISSIFVFLILLLFLKNLKNALIAFLPMGMSWYIVLGMMALVGVKFNLINIVVSTFIFGMGVDYSIFVMDGLINGSKRTDLLQYHQTAIFFSAVVLIIAVVSLMLAQHPAIKSIGFSTLVGMISTILITFTLQPFLYKKLTK